MNTIDQRILIPASPELIWAYLSDITKNPEWQQDCRQISFLTSTHKGQGTRWRSTTSGRGENVIEITAWYERIGYEYRIVDGASFKENKGRIRLQDTPEGTIVQWTFNYEPSGVLGGLRNSLSTRRNEENKIVESLWSLWRSISQQRDQITVPYTAKSLMQDAPDVEARAQYIPRHPSAIKNNQPEGLTIPEPPIAEDDTRPRPELTTSEAIVLNVTEPDFLQDISDDKSISATQQTLSKPGEETVEVNPAPAAGASIDWIAPTTEEISTRLEPSPTSGFDPANLPPVPPIDPNTDTGSISVFDLFGLPKPSETQEMRSITTPIESPVTQHTPKSSTGRRGLRRILRSKLVNLRDTQ